MLRPVLTCLFLWRIAALTSRVIELHCPLLIASHIPEEKLERYEPSLGKHINDFDQVVQFLLFSFPSGDSEPNRRVQCNHGRSTLGCNLLLPTMTASSSF
ncbi:hypothetical protein CPB85DRAFT_1388247 [Mucidula mucida]|nr:hypothetical protein CPB85DRAFT_1388247 [Mucidula mucida]